jgi:pimeloyl-ACP methyl ester carboxylesterase
MSVISGGVPSTPTPHIPVQHDIAVHDRRVNVGGINTQYLEAGTGRPMLLVHGHEQSATSWRWVIHAEQHDVGRRPGQLEASTAMARALFDITGQREILLDQLPTLTMPTLVIWGENDYVLPAHQARAAVERLPRGRLSLFPDCGHLPHVEHPDRFATVLSDWLDEEHHHPAAN